MTTLQQRQQAAVDYGERFQESYDRMKGFEAGAEWAEAQQKWIPASEGEPEPPEGHTGDHLLCWIIQKGRRNYELAAWNFHYECWDDEDMDYHYCDHEDVAYYLPVSLPELPAQEGGQDGNNPDHSR